MQLNKLNSTKKTEKEKNSVTGRQIFLIQYLGPKHVMITSKMTVCRIESDFAIISVSQPRAV